ncbi:Peroxisome biogenesis factor 2 [Diplonema papillatum]|nr:Peroxisome biogenesis factor 2 [Diplonema papillatum]|eukprot:gene11752-18123_t
MDGYRVEDVASFGAMKDVSVDLEKESRALPSKVGTTVLRVAQLDSERLTSQVLMQLRARFRRAFMYLDFSVGWELELNTVLSLLIFWHTIWANNQTYGDRLHNVIFRSDTRARELGKYNEVLFSPSVAPSRLEKVLLCIASVIFPYLYNKMLKKSMDEGWGDQRQTNWKRQLHDSLYQLETMVKMLALANLLVFLKDGEFRSIVDRVLGLRLVNHKSKINKMSSFEFMDRQLFWKTTSDFLTFALPFVNFIPWIKRMFKSSSQGRVAGIVNSTTCPICMQNPIQLPVVTSCGHHFCYYCIQSRIVQGNKACTVCGQHITDTSRPEGRRPLAHPSDMM